MDLITSVSHIPSIGPSYTKKLEKLGIFNIHDFLYHVPHRYYDFSKTTLIANSQVGETVTIKAKVQDIVSTYTKKRKQMQLISVSDKSGSLNVVWFNQRYILSTLKKDVEVYLSGEIKWFGRQKAMMSPVYELVKSATGLHTGRLVPVYNETKGLTSKWFRARIASLLTLMEDMQEILPDDDLKHYDLLSLTDALRLIHFPDTLQNAKKARYRLAFNELLSIQLSSLYKKRTWEKTNQAHALAITQNTLNRYINSLPFELTSSQKKVIDEIIVDLKKPHPMNRLLEGDVGSGKTVVAALACYIAYANTYRAVVMAPTQILAKQHYQTLTQLLQPLGVSVGLITANMKKGGNDCDVVVGTHALLGKEDHFDKVAVVIIDEQHRFGVNQRKYLVKKTQNGFYAPDVLTMTATPIPRTIALTLYGDLDLSTLDELPAGRRKITTWIVPEDKRSSAYTWVDNEIETKNIQAFVVCPLIEESESSIMKEVKAVTVEYEKIVKSFPKRRIALLHGKLKAQVKEDVISMFRDKKYDILVTTPIIEVGIDVANATIMIIEAADRFGLAQLHQLRGRVGRSTKKSYCLLFAHAKSDKSDKRLTALTQNKTGFELAEIDLSIRGPGEIFGTKQSGFDELKIASWTDIEIIKKTKKLALYALENEDTYDALIKYMHNSQQY
ncbi:ATP-dependent DNA helicase RecG [Candidatus Woesebacteria bacterium]|nr:MAG: ATP-dependent DNA helicase RecG [Candidatus Woesebacteria bacterium]